MMLIMALSLLQATFQTANAWTINVPAACPSNAAGPIDPTFQAFAFEIASFAQYAQTTADDPSPNQFTLALMDEITSRTGGYPVIRIGGTSADYGHYDPGLTGVPIVPTAEFNNLQLINFTLVGPDFYKLTKNFESLNAKFVIQVPLAINNVSESVVWAQVAAEQVGWENIECFELGNEPNFWDGPRSRYVNASSPTGYTQGPVLGPPGWKGKPTNQSFATDCQNVTDAIVAALSIPDSREPVFQPGGLGNPGKNLSQNLDVQTFFEDGMDKNGRMKLVAGHWYQQPTGNISTLGRDLMNHSAIVSGMAWALPFIEYLSGSPQGANGSLPFDMNEVGNSLDNPQNFAFQASLGSALWQVDYQLYLASVGVRRINWQQIMRAVYGMWLPRDSGGQPAGVYSNLYAMFLVGDFIGTSGKTKIAQVDISGESDYQNTVAYMAYDDGAPQRMAIVNLNEWPKADWAGNLDTSVARQAPTYDINGLPSGWATIRYLNSDLGAHANASDITYGGSQWTYASGGREVKGIKQDTQKVWVGDDGKASFAVWDSSAALVEFGQQ